MLNFLCPHCEGPACDCCTVLVVTLWQVGAGRKFVEDSLRSLCERGARMVRLDAYGYATKKKDTRCFFEV